MQAGIGCRDHSGWVVLVAVGGDPAAPHILARERIELIDATLPRMPYHAALETSLEAGAALVADVEAAAALGAADALGALAAQLRHDGHDVRGAAIAVGTTDVPDEFATILASHTRVHAAEGELYRDALADGATRAGLTVTRFANKAAISEAANALGVATDELADRLARLGKPLGPPWQKDHREAAAAALLALVGGVSSSAG